MIVRKDGREIHIHVHLHLEPEAAEAVGGDQAISDGELETRSSLPLQPESPPSVPAAPAGVLEDSEESIVQAKVIEEERERQARRRRLEKWDPAKTDFLWAIHAAHNKGLGNDTNNMLWFTLERACTWLDYLPEQVQARIGLAATQVDAQGGEAKRSPQENRAARSLRRKLDYRLTQAIEALRDQGWGYERGDGQLGHAGHQKEHRLTPPASLARNPGISDSLPDERGGANVPG